MNNKGYFITGTGTDVGKTYVTGLIVKALAENGQNVAYYKSALSGNIRDENGKLIPGDALEVKETSNIKQDLDSMCPYIYENAYSPHLAAQVEGTQVDMQTVIEGFHQLDKTYDLVVVEGSGGIVCPIRYDGVEKIMLEDIIKKLNLPCIIVADAKLGSINSVVLTVEYMRNRNFEIEGVIFNNYTGSVIEKDNLKMCKELAGVKIIAIVEPDAKEIKLELQGGQK